MSFLWPDLLWGLLLVPVLIAVYVWAQRRRQQYALRYASLSLVREALGRGPGIRRHIPPVLFLLALTTMIVAMARPVATVILPSQQGTVILSIDISGSMRAEDLQPNRMEAAKNAAIAFVDKQPRNVRIGVVAFSGAATVVQAATTDREAVIGAISRLAPQRATAIGSGILTSLEAVFEEETATQGQAPSARGALVPIQPTPTREAVPRGSYAPAVVVLMSDGQSNAGPRPIEVAKQAADRGVRIYTVGMGNPDGAVLRVEGRSVRVRLDEETLKAVAEETDGEYFRADSETDLVKIYENLSTQIVFRTEQTELTAGFTGAAGLILLLSGLLSLLWFNRLP
jgi:Ca-activated chloride channel family protein